MDIASYIHDSARAALPKDYTIVRFEKTEDMEGITRNAVLLRFNDEAHGDYDREAHFDVISGEYLGDSLPEVRKINQMDDNAQKIKNLIFDNTGKRTTGFLVELFSKLIHGQKIQAIKDIRDVTRMGLAESKVFVEKLLEMVPACNSEVHELKTTIAKLRTELESSVQLAKEISDRADRNLQLAEDLRIDEAISNARINMISSLSAQVELERTRVAAYREVLKDISANQGKGNA